MWTWVHEYLFCNKNVQCKCPWDTSKNGLKYIQCNYLPYFSTHFLWDWNENWPFPTCGDRWVFKICWHTECSTLTASSFRILKSSARILSPPLALLITKDLPPFPHTSGTWLLKKICMIYIHIYNKYIIISTIFHPGLIKSRGTRYQIANIRWTIEKAREF